MSLREEETEALNQRNKDNCHNSSIEYMNELERKRIDAEKSIENSLVYVWKKRRSKWRIKSFAGDSTSVIATKLQSIR